ncbi:MAG: hypothetical protein JNM27_03125 [Leptospirales bacterium]|nr:hypothetical protein [Leptospirales bacterium]
MKPDAFYVQSPARRARVLRSLIFSAKESIIMQMYLFAARGELRTLQPVEGPPWAELVADWLIERKAQRPDLKILVLLDSQTIADAKRTTGKQFPLTRHRLEDAGIVVLTASLRRTVFKPSLFHSLHKAWEGNGVRREKDDWATLQHNWQTAHNVEDHRKNIVIDSGRAGIVFSHNLIDQARFWQENTFLLRNQLARDLYGIALVAGRDALGLPVRFSENDLSLLPWLERQALSHAEEATTPLEGDAGSPGTMVERQRILDGGPEIRRAILDEMDRVAHGEIRVASAYYSDMETLARLSDVSRNVRVRILIDSCNALALPNVLHYLLKNTVNILCIHFCRKFPQLELRIFPSVRREMMHMKAISFSEGPCLIAGQANFTPNSFSGAWLETSVRLSQSRIVKQFDAHFDQLWERSDRVIPYVEMTFFQSIRTRTHEFVFLFMVRVAGWLGFRY